MSHVVEMQLSYLPSIQVHSLLFDMISISYVAMTVYGIKIPFSFIILHRLLYIDPVSYRS